MSNLEATINILGYDIASIINENEINKLLGVLSNDGVYAHWVYFCNKLGMEKSMKFWSQFLLKEEIKSLFINNSEESIKKYLGEFEGERDKKKQKKIYESWHKEVSSSFFHKLSEKLDELLFFREILEKVLIYARYHAKALDVN